MFLVPTRSPRRVEHFSCLTRRNPTVRNSGIEERRFKRKNKLKSHSPPSDLLYMKTDQLLFVLFVFLFFFIKIESGTHIFPFALLGPFQARNNLFYPGFSSIYLKWKFFKYLTFFGIFFKIFIFWVHLIPIASNLLKIRLSHNSMKFDWVTRFRETNSTVKSVLSSEI